MKIMRNSIFKLAALGVLSATTLLGGSLSADAKPNDAKSGMRGKGHRRGGMNVQRLAKKLNLTESQKTQIQNITQQSRTAAQAVKSNTSLSQEQKRAQL